MISFLNSNTKVLNRILVLTVALPLVFGMFCNTEGLKLNFVSSQNLQSSNLIQVNSAEFLVSAIVPNQPTEIRLSVGSDINCETKIVNLFLPQNPLVINLNQPATCFSFSDNIPRYNFNHHLNVAIKPSYLQNMQLNSIAVKINTMSIKSPLLPSQFPFMPISWVLVGGMVFYSLNFYHKFYANKFKNSSFLANYFLINKIVVLRC